VNLAGNKSRLVGVTKALELKWEDTKVSWRDARSDEFERRYLLELFILTDKTVSVIEKLSELLAKVRKDCE
jgi:hypothetical protein